MIDICRYMQIYVDILQVYVDICRYMQIHCRYVQIYVDVCRHYASLMRVDIGSHLCVHKLTSFMQLSSQCLIYICMYSVLYMLYPMYIYVYISRVYVSSTYVLSASYIYTCIHVIPHLYIYFKIKLSARMKTCIKVQLFYQQSFREYLISPLQYYN